MMKYVRKWMTTVRLKESGETNEEACLNRLGYCVLGSAEWSGYDIEAFCSKCGYSIWFGEAEYAYWQRVR